MLTEDLSGVRVIALRVLRSVGPDCTNSGVSAGNDWVYLIHPKGPQQATEVDAELVFRGQDAGGGYHRMVPVVHRTGLAGPMAGGNVATTSDSRVRHVYHIHDRWETWEQYRLLATD